MSNDNLPPGISDRDIDFLLDAKEVDEIGTLGEEDVREDFDEEGVEDEVMDKEL